MDHLLTFSLRYRFFTLVAIAVVIATGIWSFRNLTIDAVPDLTPVQVQVLTLAAGQGIGAATAIQHVVAGVAGQHVGLRRAGDIEIGVARQRQPRRAPRFRRGIFRAGRALRCHRAGLARLWRLDTVCRACRRQRDGVL